MIVLVLICCMHVNINQRVDSYDMTDMMRVIFNS